LVARVGQPSKKNSKSRQRRRIVVRPRQIEDAEKLKLSNRQFERYLVKIGGNQKHIKRYDTLLQDDKKIDVGALKRKATEAKAQLEQIKETEAPKQMKTVVGYFRTETSTQEDEDLSRI
jgi:hypothetical protein